MSERASCWSVVYWFCRGVNTSKNGDKDLSFGISEIVLEISKIFRRIFKIPRGIFKISFEISTHKVIQHFRLLLRVGFSISFCFVENWLRFSLWFGDHNEVHLTLMKQVKYNN